MSVPVPGRLLPRGLVTACLLASVLSGPGMLLLLEVYVMGGAMLAVRWPSIGTAMNLPPPPIPIEAVDLLAPLVALPITLPLSLILVFPLALAGAAGLCAALAGSRRLGRRATWAAAGATCGALLGMMVFTVMNGPIQAAGDRGAQAVLGALDGVACALVVRARLARRGAFNRPG